MAVKGRQQRGRSGEFRADRVVRANVPFHPGDELRAKFERAVTGMGVSGNEVLREAFRRMELDEDGRPAGWPAQEVIAEAS
ncbi:hypothetical protein [Streptomyces sp. NRRL F-525]|uniref:hypothetical protein n=1 Tax=Streptomyces sp. NRRL F-525 TaxID=1463861 RepID=UPI00131C7252|nr:hypothetical protein [Streptomyces sp. NRRL F-525]